VTEPAGVIRAIFPEPPVSVTQRLPSGPAAIPRASPDMGRAVSSEMASESTSSEPSEFTTFSVNHSESAGPAVMPQGLEFGVRPVENSVTVGS
jgi:hypothetical protein